MYRSRHDNVFLHVFSWEYCSYLTHEFLRSYYNPFVLTKVQPRIGKWVIIDDEHITSNEFHIIIVLS